MKRLFCAIVAVMLVCCAALADIPEPDAEFYYYDGACVLSDLTKDVIYFNNEGIDHEGGLRQAAEGAQIVIVTVSTTGSVPIDQYALELFNGWGIGDAQENNGLLLLLAIDDDDYWWMPGSGFGSIADDDTVDNIVWTYLEPYFAAKRYDEGVLSVFERLFLLVRDSYGADIDYIDGDAVLSLLHERGPQPEAGTAYQAAGSGLISTGVLFMIMGCLRAVLFG